jgi:Putative Ig domain
VSDGDVYRVLAFNVNPSSITNGEPASYVLGQNSFTTDTYGTSQNAFETVYGLGFDPTSNTLFVDDTYDDCRILLFNFLNGISNDMNASGVIGAPNFNSTDCGNSQSQLEEAYSNNLAVDSTNGRLYFPDYDQDRTLIFNFVHIDTPANTPIPSNASVPSGSTLLPIATQGSNYNTSLETENYQGTVSYSVTGGNLPPGVALNYTTGAITGTPTTTGTYTFEITVADNNGSIGVFYEDPSYTIIVDGMASASTSTAPDTGYGQPVSYASEYILFTMSFAMVVTGALSLFVNKKQR